MENSHTAVSTKKGFKDSCLPYFHWEQNKPNLTIIESFLCWNSCGETSWQEQNQGKCKPDTPCLAQKVCVQEWTQTKSQSNMKSWHDVSPQVPSVKAGRQQMWVRWQEFVWVVHVLHLTELSSSSLLNHIASPKNKPCGCCVDAAIRLFDQQHP